MLSWSTTRTTIKFAMMKTPPHPGTILREDVLNELGLDITEASRRLGMTRSALSRVIHGRTAMTSDLAVRLERAGVSTARAWMALQSNYDISQALQREQPKVIPIQAA